MHQIRFRLGLHPRPHWRSSCPVLHIARFKGSYTSKRRGRKGGQGIGRGGGQGIGRGGEGKRRGGKRGRRGRGKQARGEKMEME